MTTTVTESNHVAIPSDIVREFNIRPGTRLEWAKSAEGGINVKPLPSRGELARRLLGAGRRFLKEGTNPIDDLIRERDEDDELDRIDAKP